MCNITQASHKKDHIVIGDRFIVPLDTKSIEFPEYVTNAIKPGTLDCLVELRTLVWGINMTDRIERGVIPARVLHLYLPPTYTHPISASELNHKTIVGVHISRINDQPAGNWFFVYGRDQLAIDHTKFDNDTHDIYGSDDVDIYGYFNKRYTVKRKSLATKYEHDASKYYISPGTFTLMLAESQEKKAIHDAKLKQEAEGIAHMLAIEIHDILYKRVEDGTLANTTLSFNTQTSNPRILKLVQTILEETFPSITFKITDWLIDSKKVICSYSSPPVNQIIACH